MMSTGTLIVGLAVACGPASTFGQAQVGGMPAPEATSAVLPRPDPAFKGKIGETYKDSTPSYPQAVKTPSGSPNVLLTEFVPDGSKQGGGTLKLFVDGKPAGEGKLKRSAFRHGLEPFEVGRDSITPIDPVYKDIGTFPFTGAIDKITFALAPAGFIASIEGTSQVADEGAPLAQSPLKELAWTVGDWVDDGENRSFESSVKWSKNGAFLIHSFRVSNPKADPHSGMQIIAWDPAEKRIRSWTYDSRGGFGEESWSRSGDRWSIRKKFTLPDGGRASAVQVMTRVSDDAYRWKSVNRVIDGTLHPDTDEITVIRKPPEAGAEAPESPKPPESSTPKGEN
jgi:hypothetical protein